MTFTPYTWVLSIAGTNPKVASRFAEWAGAPVTGTDTDFQDAWVRFLAYGPRAHNLQTLYREAK